MPIPILRRKKITLIAKRPKTEDFPPVDAGTFQGVCYSVIDLGTQHTTYEGQEGDKAQVLITWEIPELRIKINDQDLPRAISKRYTNSLGKKATLFQHLESWRGKAFTKDELNGFDVVDVLGANSLLAILNNTNKDGEVRARVSSVMHLPKGMPILKAENPLVSYSIDRDGIDGIPAGVPSWIQDIIKQSMEYRAIHSARSSAELAKAQANYATPPTDVDDDLPF